MLSLIETSDQHRKRIEALAAPAFAKHVLVAEGPGRWLCGVPHNSIYAFRVVVGPGFILLHGDIGELVLSTGRHDSLQWLRASVHNLDYCLEKAKRPEMAFFEGDTVQLLKEWEADGSWPVEEIKEAWDNYKLENDRYLPEHAWHLAVYEVTQDCEVPLCMSWSSQMLWQWLGLQKFVQLLDKEIA
jgi:hypothetical protein